MADPCICDDNLEVDETGRLCATPGAVGLRQVLVYESSGTFTKATYPWLVRVRAIVQGGGGGGGGTADASIGERAAGAGGGAGGCGDSLLAASALAASEVVTVGAGGTAVAGANGGNGGDSSFGAHVIGEGGEGGEACALSTTTSTYASAGEGGGATGQIERAGGDGTPGMAQGDSGIMMPGAGGPSYFGSGGLMRRASSIGTAVEANSGGGGAGATSSTTGARAGATGGSGIVVLELYG